MSCLAGGILCSATNVPKWAHWWCSGGGMQPDTNTHSTWDACSCLVGVEDRQTPPTCPNGHIGGVQMGEDEPDRKELEWRTAKHHQHAQMGTLVVFRWERMSRTGKHVP